MQVGLTLPDLHRLYFGSVNRTSGHLAVRGVMKKCGPVIKVVHLFASWYIFEQKVLKLPTKKWREDASFCRSFFRDAQVAKRPVFAAALCSVAGLGIKKDPLIQHDEVSRCRRQADLRMQPILSICLISCLRSRRITKLQNYEFKVIVNFFFGWNPILFAICIYTFSKLMWGLGAMAWGGALSSALP
jgi:hypothetical protein